MIKPLDATTTSKPNFYYIVYDIYIYIYIVFLIETTLNPPPKIIKLFIIKKFE